MSGTVFWPWPRVVAHRCCGTLAPENTMAALAAAGRYGVRAVECDARLAADGAVVISHDDELGRAVAGSGRISRMTLPEVLKLDAGGIFSPEYAGEPVMMLSEAAEFCSANGIWMNIEIKGGSGRDAETVRRVLEELEPFYASGCWSGNCGPLFSSFGTAALAAMKELAPDLPRALLLEENVPAGWLETARQLEVRSVHPDVSSLSQEFVQTAHAAGLAVMCYTLDDLECGRELAAWGVDAFCTNRPDIMAGVFSHPEP